MKKSLLLIPLCLLFFSSAIAQQYAPAAKFKTDAPPMMQDKIPSAEEVNIPAYPGMVVLSVHNPPQGAENVMAPYMNLASQDPPGQVEAWYRERLLKMAGWKYHDTYEFFYKGEDPMKAVSMQSPYVNVMELDQEALDLIYVDNAVKERLKTRIQIIYQPEDK